MIECVPNISEGRRRAVIDALVAAVRTTTGVRVLDVSSDASHNRSVITMVGDPTPLRTAVLTLCERAIEAIDLRQHTGEHPRLGTVDVVPFVPIADASMADCVALARDTASAVDARFSLPVFLYEQAATTAARRNLSEIRRGEFEGLAAKLSDPRSAAYLERVLIERQRKIGRHWLAKVDPLDRFEVRGPVGDEMLCATDLLVHHRLDRGFAGATYFAAAFAGDGRRLPWRRSVRADATGKFCVDALPRGSGSDGYVIVSVATRRGKKQLPAVFVHMARKRGTGTLRVIGLDRRL